MKSMVRSVLAILVIAACGRDGAITAPSVPNANAGTESVLAIGTDPNSGATIETNKDDYQPGEIVHVVGRGWAPNETVNLHMTEEPDTHADVDTNVVADANGAFSVHYYDVTEHDIGVTFSLTATGLTSGSSATAIFTDGTIEANPTFTFYPGGSTSGTPPSSCTGAPGTTVTSGTQMCVVASFNIIGSGGTHAQLRWKSPGSSGTVVDVDQRSPSFDDTGSKTFAATFTPTVDGTWSVLLCESNNGSTSGSNATGCANGAVAGGTATFTVASSAPTTTSLSSSPDPSVTGQSVTLTAIVMQGVNPVTSGSVTFRRGGTDCSTGTVIAANVALNGSGVSTASVPFNAEDSPISLRACYSGASGFASSNGTDTHTVNQASTITSLGDDIDPSSVGQTVVFTATVASVAPAVGTPGGTITLYEFTGVQTCAAPGGATALGGSPSALVGGTVNINVSTLTAGAHDITACYSGDANFTASSDVESHAVDLVGTTTSVGSSPSPSVTGQNVTFTATVTRTVGGAAVTSGAVVFKTGGTDCASATFLANGSALTGAGQSSHTAPFQADQSPLTVRACYTEGTTYGASEGSVVHTINKANTTTSPSKTPVGSATTVFGESVTFGATVAVVLPGTGTPSGDVKFWLLTSGNCVSPTGTLLGTGTLAAGVTSINTIALGVGTHTIHACYQGDDNYNASNNTIQHTVEKAQTTLSLTTNGPVFFGLTSTFTATISVNAPGAGTPTGAVNFSIDGTCQTSGSISDGTPLPSGSTNVSISGGQAQFSTTALNAGTYNIVACYGGDGNFLGDGDNESHTVNPAVTKAELVSSPDPSSFGAQVTFTATVSIDAGKGAGIPTGTVYFHLGGTNCTDGELLGSDPVDGTGVAAINVTSGSLDVTGSPHTVRACFDNTDGNFTDSNVTDTHTVNAAATTTTIAVAPSSQQYSDKVLFTATVAPATVLGSTQAGTVQFKVEGTNTGAAEAITCGATQCTATLTYTITQQASPPTLAISAAFTSTNPNFANSASTTDATLTVTKEDATVYDAAVSPSNILINGSGTLTFKVRETNGSKATELNPAAQIPNLVEEGDISYATVTVTAKGVLTNTTLTLSCLTPASNGSSGYAEILTVTCSFGPVGTADTYEVDMTVTGNYYQGAGATVIQVTDPDAGFTTGGGWYWHEGNPGGEKVNFGFMGKATQNRNKTVFQGSLLVIRHKANGDIIKIKSNMFEGYAISAPPNACASTTFTGKATYAVNGSSFGNHKFTGYGMDCGEPGTADKFGLFHEYSPNEVNTATSAGNLPASAKTLQGGNVQVPQPSGKK